MSFKTISQATFLLSLFALGQLQAAIVNAVFDPADHPPLSDYSLERDTAGDTVIFNTDSGELSLNGNVVHSANLDTDTSNNTPYWVFSFSKFSLGSNVTIEIVTASPNAAPINGLAILSTGTFNLETNITFSDAGTGQGNIGGNISLISVGDMVISATINTDGGDGKGSNTTGRNAGMVTIATGSNLDATSLVISAEGGDGTSKNADGGSGGVVEIYANTITGTLQNPLNNGGAADGSGSSGNTPVFSPGNGDFTGVNFPAPNLVYLAAIPEPSSSLLIAASSLFFFSRRRRAA